MIPMWLRRFLNRIGLRKDTMVCIYKDDAYCWPDHLGERMEGKCAECDGPLYFEKQNAPFHKICSRCCVPW